VYKPKASHGLDLNLSARTFIITETLALKSFEFKQKTAYYISLHFHISPFQDLKKKERKGLWTYPLDLLEPGKNPI